MKVAVCLPGQSYSGRFIVSLVNLISGFQDSGIKFGLFQSDMANIFKLREALATQVIKQFEYDYMLWIDSDQTFNRNDFFNLLSADKDIASGCYRIINGNYCFGYFDQDPRVNVSEITQKECFEVDFAGFGFMLIKKGVFEKLGTPYFNPIYDKKYDNFMGEDEGFCVKAKNAGFKIFCSPSVKIGHEKQLII